MLGRGTNSGVVPSILNDSLAELLKGIESTHACDADQFSDLLAHLLAFLSQIAIAAYAAQPSLHTPELNTLLRHRRFRNLTLGMRLEYIRSILRLERIHADDILFHLKSAMGKRRSEEEFPRSMYSVVINAFQRKARSNTFMDFLDACVRIRNWIAHRETRPVRVSDEALSDWIRSAFTGVSDFLETLREETQCLDIIEVLVAEEDDNDEVVVPFHRNFGEEEETGRASIRKGGRGSLSIHAGCLYPVLLPEEGEKKGSDLFLLEISFFPLIVLGEALSRATQESNEEIQQDDLYVLMGASKNKLLFAPLTTSSGGRVEVGRASEPGMPPFVDSYNVMFEQLK